MTNYTKRPNLVRDWLMNKLTVWKKFLDEKIKIARVNGTINDEFDLKTVDKETLQRIGLADSNGKASIGTLSAGDSDMGDVDYLQFSDDEDEYASLKGKNVLQGGVFRR